MTKHGLIAILAALLAMVNAYFSVTSVGLSERYAFFVCAQLYVAVIFIIIACAPKDA